MIRHYLTGAAVSLGTRLVALNNKKARRIIAGRRETVSRLKARITPERPVIWFHAASLGEFEQGRPLMEAIRERAPEWQIILSFFSPSGYEVRHDYAGVDCVVYLPNDMPWSVEGFLDAAHPDKAVFVKYDFWPVMLASLRKRGIPTYLISAIFQPRQHFFKPWGKPYRDLLHHIDYLWVQDKASVDLLSRYGVYHADVSGDTRFDRVMAIASESTPIPEIASLRERSQCIIVGGSTWPQDEEVLLEFVARHPEVSLVLAPHEIHEEHLCSIEAMSQRPSVRLSQLREGTGSLDGVGVVIIDCFGLLASLYRYADIAYIGGGFGKGIHNTVEAAVYGLPLVFGPNIRKFREAQLFRQGGAALVAQTPGEVGVILERLCTNQDERLQAAEASRRIVESQLGATEIILEHLGFAQPTSPTDDNDTPVQ